MTLIKPSAAVADSIRGRGRKVDEGRLEKLRDQVGLVRSLDQEIADLEEELAEKKAERYRMVSKTLPDLFNEVGMTGIDLDAKGNDPAYEARSAPYYSANIAAEWPDDKKQTAFDMLKKLKAPDLTKTTIKVAFGKGETKTARAAISALRKMKVPIEINKGVHSSTLTAWVRGVYEEGGSLSKHELEVLGASVGTMVSIKPKKQKKQKSVTVTLPKEN